MEGRSYQGVHYYFITYKHDESKWVLNKQRFLLSPYKSNNQEKLLGQYITSMWYNYPIDPKSEIKFAVVGVSNKNQLGATVDLLNSNSSLWGATCEFIDIFEGNLEATQKIVTETKDKQRSNYMFAGNINSNNTLRVNFNFGDNNHILANLPEFTRVI